MSIYYGGERYICDESTLVCPTCTGNEGLETFIRKYGQEGECTYCKNKEEPVCSLDPLLDHILDCVEQEYGHPDDEGVPYISREGGYQLPVYHTYELLWDFLDDPFLSHVTNAIQCDAWSERDPFTLRWNDTLRYAWEGFSDFIMKQARFFFLKVNHPQYDESQHDELNPVDVLQVLSSLIKETGLVTTLETETRFYRIRIVDEKTVINSAKELGSPPFEFSNMPNRMSPVGVSMFYGAFDLHTAIAETYSRKKDKNKKLISDDVLRVIYGTDNVETILANDLETQGQQKEETKDKKLVCGEFVSTRPLTVIDLSQFSGVPDFFDPDQYKKRRKFMFLRDFISDISRPITRDDRAHVEYIPTQVVTEYLRYLFRTEDGRSINGLIYPSSRNGEKSIVLFANNSQSVLNNS